MDPIRYGCALLVLAACCGCRMCQSHTDCLPPVLDGPYSHVSGRAGSAFTGGSAMITQMQYLEESVGGLPDPAPVEAD